MMFSREWPRRRTALLLPLILTVGLAAACGQQGRTAPAAPSARQAPAEGAPMPLTTAAAAMFPRAADALVLPYHDYRRDGSWSLADATDATAAFTENGRSCPRLWLMDLAGGRTRLVLPAASCGRPGFWLGTVQVSDAWVVWEEVGPGDDLMEQVEWRLYAARLRRPALRLEQPRLVATGRRSPRPLFDVAGSRLAWIRTSGTGSAARARSRLLLENLADGRRRVVYRSRGLLETVSFSGGKLLVGEVRLRPGKRGRLLLLDGADNRLVSSYEGGGASVLSHWPAWRDGRLAWTPFAAQDSPYPYLYVRDPAGATTTDGGSAIDPCFVGGYLFYQARRVGGAGGSPVLEVRALRLKDGLSFVLESGRPDDNMWWRGVVGPTDLQHTYVAYLDRALLAQRATERSTLIRVYQVP